MSNLTNQQKATISTLFDLTSGYVCYAHKPLFRNKQAFRDCIACASGIDVYENSSYQSASSMGKKLILFIDKEDDAIVGKVLSSLLSKRNEVIEKNKHFYENEWGQDFVDQDAEAAEEVQQIILTLQGNINFHTNDAQRLEITIAESRVLLQDLIKIGDKVCNSHKFDGTTRENTINDYFRDGLDLLGYEQVMDQTRHGLSEKGKDAGSVDLLIKKGDKEKAIIEGLKLKCLDQGNITTHIDKAITNYNALGTPTFILAYVSAADFKSFWDKYFLFLQNFNFICPKARSIEEIPKVNAAIRTATTVLDKDGYCFPVYFICLNIKK